jgi:hypothetical protein
MDPQEPPLTISYGFWLQNLTPPEYTNSRILALSNCYTREPDYIYQLSDNQGIAGIVWIELKDTLDDPPRPELSWIKFGFKNSNIPVLWFGNDTQCPGLKERLGRAVASRRDVFEKDSMEEDWPTEKPSEYEGELVVDVDPEAQPHEVVIDKLCLKISVKLQKNNNPAIPLSRSTEDSRLLQKHSMVWAVDIVEAEQPQSIFGAGLENLKGVWWR